MKKGSLIRFNKILDKLQGKIKGTKYRYLASCPAHNDKNSSLWIMLKANGRICVHCLAGCSLTEIRKALGAKNENTIRT